MVICYAKVRWYAALNCDDMRRLSATVTWRESAMIVCLVVNSESQWSHDGKLRWVSALSALGFLSYDDLDLAPLHHSLLTDGHITWPDDAFDTGGRRCLDTWCAIHYETKCTVHYETWCAVHYVTKCAVHYETWCAVHYETKFTVHYQTLDLFRANNHRTLAYQAIAL